MKLNNEQIEAWHAAKPYSHLVVDNFLNEKFASEIAEEFLLLDSNAWFEYSNVLEEKRACPDWNFFPSSIYKALTYLLSDKVTSELKRLTENDLEGDYGLNGGGMHSLGRGGKLNPHLDYSIHPSLQRERKINIILYVSKEWNPAWGGALGMWSHDSVNNAPRDLIKSVDCVFNRAVIFDTTQNSWHGLPEPLVPPHDKFRNSLAVYYTQPLCSDVDERQKALFAPTNAQKGDEEVERLIRYRSDINKSKLVYRNKP